MKSWYTTCTLLLILTNPVLAQAPPSGPADRIAAAHQFLREFFPQLAGHTAEIEYTAGNRSSQRLRTCRWAFG